MAATIKIKNSSTAGAAPTSSDLVQGELAVNVTDKRLYTENASGTVVELGTNPSVPVTFPDGSASAPSLTNDGDTNTGIFFPAADTVGITTGGSERARVDSSGNLGIGVTPSGWVSSVKALDINAGASFVGSSLAASMWSNALVNTSSSFRYKNNGVAAFYDQASGQHAWYIAPSGTAGNVITFTQAMTLDASGNLFVGGTAQVYGEKLLLKTASGDCYTTMSNGTGSVYVGWSSSGVGFIGTATNHAQTFYTNGTERARIDSSGNLLVGTTDSSDTSGTGIKLRYTSGTSLAVTCTANTSGGLSTYHFYNTNATNNGYRFYVNINGGISNYSGNNINLSDERTKTNIELAGSYLSKVCAIPVKLFNYKDEAEGEQRTLGVIAQDVEAVAPELVDQNGWLGEAPEGEAPLKSIYTTDLMFALMKSIQEQQAIITQLQADVAALKG